MDRNIEILYLGDCEEENGYATVEEVKNLLDFDINLDKTIYDKFQIENVIRESKNSRIKGSADIIRLFENFKIEKYDIKSKFGNVKYIGINDKKEVMLYFPDYDIKASSIYNFSSQFYDKFKIRGYAKHCIEINRHDIISKNVNEMLTEMKEEENQYRLLKRDREYYLRALTSKNYRNYDNKMAVYLVIYALEKLINDKNYIYNANSGYIGDSSMSLLFTKETNIEVSDICKINFGLNLSNSELADEALSISLRYVITDNEGRNFSAMIEKPICRIIHDMKMDNFEKRYNEIFKLEEHESNVLDIIRTINTSEQLSEDGVYYLLKRTVDRISDDKDITRETKDKFKDLKEHYIIESTLTLIKFFDKLSSIKTDISERIFIERIFHQVIQDYCEIKGIRR